MLKDNKLSNHTGYDKAYFPNGKKVLQLKIDLLFAKKITYWNIV